MASSAKLLTLLLVAALAAVGSGCDDEDRSTSERRPSPASPARDWHPDAPNVVVVMTDDQAIDTMQALPYTTRVVGGEGTSFRNAVASFPLCCPSRASFLTGQYAHNHGVLDNHPPRGGFGRLDGRHTLPVWLARAGYRTAFVGKYLNGYGQPENGGPRLIPPGWSEWRAELARDKSNMFDYGLNVNGRIVQYGSRPRDYKTDVLTRHAGRVIRDRLPARRPLFLWIATSAPHAEEDVAETAPRNPRPTSRDLGGFEGAKPPTGPAFDERRIADKPRFVRRIGPLRRRQIEAIDRFYVSQLESLGAVDDLVRRVVSELRRAGELERTLLVFTSDNGQLRGQHRQVGKSLMYEEAIRVPLLVRGPGFRGGSEIERPVANVDLAPTILSLAHAEPTVPLDGLPLSAAPRRRAILLEVFERRHGQLTGLRTARHAYAEYAQGGETELYDLRRDPHELRNLAADRHYERVLGRLGHTLARLRDCAGPACH